MVDDDAWENKPEDTSMLTSGVKHQRMHLQRGNRTRHMQNMCLTEWRECRRRFRVAQKGQALDNGRKIFLWACNTHKRRVVGDGWRTWKFYCGNIIGWRTSKCWMMDGEQENVIMGVSHTRGKDGGEWMEGIPDMTLVVGKRQGRRTK